MDPSLHHPHPMSLLDRSRPCSYPSTHHPLYRKLDTHDCKEPGSPNSSPIARNQDSHQATSPYLAPMPISNRSFYHPARTPKHVRRCQRSGKNEKTAQIHRTQTICHQLQQLATRTLIKQRLRQTIQTTTTPPAKPALTQRLRTQYQQSANTAKNTHVFRTSQHKTNWIHTDIRHRQIAYQLANHDHRCNTRLANGITTATYLKPFYTMLKNGLPSLLLYFHSDITCLRKRDATNDRTPL